MVYRPSILLEPCLHRHSTIAKLESKPQSKEVPELPEQGGEVSQY